MTGVPDPGPGCRGSRTRVLGFWAFVEDGSAEAAKAEKDKKTLDTVNGIPPLLDLIRDGVDRACNLALDAEKMIKAQPKPWLRGARTRATKFDEDLLQGIKVLIGLASMTRNQREPLMSHSTKD